MEPSPAHAPLRRCLARTYVSFSTFWPSGLLYAFAFSSESRTAWSSLDLYVPFLVQLAVIVVGQPLLLLLAWLLYVPFFYVKNHKFMLQGKKRFDQRNKS